MVEESESPFTADIMRARFPNRFRLPQITPFTRNTDPTEHMELLWIYMELHDASDATMCRAFSLTLADTARLWFKQLKSRSISTFSKLSQAFVTNFIRGKKTLKAPAHLLHVIQKEGELLKDYIKRFNLEALKVQKHSDEVALNVIMSELRDKPFLFSLDKNPPATMAEFLNLSQKYANIEESRILRDAAQSKNSLAKEQSKAEPSSTNKKRKDDCRSNKRLDRKFKTYTPLNKTLEQVLIEIKDKRLLHWPNKQRGNTDRRSKSKYCCFHRDHGHNTSDCFDLKQEIEKLIRDGHLEEYVSLEENQIIAREKQPIDNHPTGKIRTIFGGHKGGGDSNNARKVHVESISHPEEDILLLGRPSKEKKMEKYSLTFTVENAQGIHHPHNDVLVVTLTIANQRVFWILADTGSLVDVLFT
ncbi:uncharacterized protein LOC131226754 [Magnolia sinica]|uniref:uncharacterized protein LOC131226754 n=1 Tax=Magnolia sinica TaxID=86752 RepID=UPI00265A7D04|nr:uncharacterized protein LOC131226754 [Magnolia sinica]